MSCCTWSFWSCGAVLRPRGVQHVIKAELSRTQMIFVVDMCLLNRLLSNMLAKHFSEKLADLSVRLGARTGRRQTFSLQSTR